MNINYISKIFTQAIFSGLIMLALFGVSASKIKGQQTTANIFVKKDVCNRINPTTNACNGSNQGLKDANIEFTVELGTLSGTNPVLFTPAGGAALPSIFVKINLANFSAGQTKTDDIFTTGTTVRVCEIAPDGFASTPQPELSTGGSDTFAQGNCIITTLRPGNNVVQFANSRIAFVPTAATAMIAGRVTANIGVIRGSERLSVTILNTRTNDTQTVFTNRLGYYEFNDLQVGDTYVISVHGKGYNFTPQIISLNEDSALDMLGTYIEGIRLKGGRRSF